MSEPISGDDQWRGSILVWPIKNHPTGDEASASSYNTSFLNEGEAPVRSGAQALSQNYASAFKPQSVLLLPYAKGAGLEMISTVTEDLPQLAKALLTHTARSYINSKNEGALVNSWHPVAQIFNASVVAKKGFVEPVGEAARAIAQNPTEAARSVAQSVSGSAADYYADLTRLTHDEASSMRLGVATFGILGGGKDLLKGLTTWLRKSASSRGIHQGGADAQALKTFAPLTPNQIARQIQHSSKIGSDGSPLFEFNYWPQLTARDGNTTRIIKSEEHHGFSAVYSQNKKALAIGMNETADPKWSAIVGDPHKMTSALMQALQRRPVTTIEVYLDPLERTSRLGPGASREAMAINHGAIQALKEAGYTLTGVGPNPKMAGDVVVMTAK